MDVINLFAERDIQMQLWCLFWIMIGNFAIYVWWKKTNDRDITFVGVIKKIFVGLFAWGLFLIAYQGIEIFGHVQAILPSLSWGIFAEIIVGGFIQQKIEGVLKSSGNKQKSEKKKTEAK